MIKVNSNNRSNNSFTLMEILIFLTLLISLLASVPITLNFKTQIMKSYDLRRKKELSTLQKILEDFYNDKKRYPKPEEICSEVNPINPCVICGNKNTPVAFSHYLNKLPCDPQYPTKNYLYQVNDVDNPSWYRIYVKLTNEDDPVIKEVGCQYGCGLSPEFAYNYGISSPNINLQKNDNLCSRFSYLYINPGCNNCGNYAECKLNFPNEIYYIDSISCNKPCIKD